MSHEFHVATKVLCCKEDIPQVEAVKRLLFAPLKGALVGLGKEILERVNDRLDELETTVGAPDVDILRSHPDGREPALRELMASILVSFAAGATGPLPRGAENLIRDAASGLLDLGADEIGAPRNYPQRPLVQAGLIAELRTMVLHLLNARRTDVEQAVRHFLTSSDPRTKRSQILLSGLPESELPRSREEFDVLLAVNLLVPGPSDQLPVGGSAVALVDLRIDTALDIWAYSAFVAGEVHAAQATGVTTFFAWALLDGGTTRFCKWVHRRKIPVRALEKELGDRRRAAFAGNGEALIAGRKFLSPKVARSGTPSQFARFFRTAGLPQYHIGCRTIVRSVLSE